jgi:hypothetical protein
MTPSTRAAAQPGGGVGLDVGPHHQRPAERLGDAGHALEQLVEVGVAEDEARGAGEHEADRLGAAARQRAGGEVGPVADLVRELLHPGARRGPDLPVVAQGARDGRAGDPESVGQVL